MLFLLLRLPMGTIDFTIAVTIVALMLQWIVAPILVVAGVDNQIGSWTIDTFGESLIWFPISLLFVLVGPGSSSVGAVCRRASPRRSWASSSRTS